MANPVLKGQVLQADRRQFGSVLGAAVRAGRARWHHSDWRTISASASRALPCNVKVLAVAVEFEDTTLGTQVPGADGRPQHQLGSGRPVHDRAFVGNA